MMPAIKYGCLVRPDSQTVALRAHGAQCAPREGPPRHKTKHKIPSFFPACMVVSFGEECTTTWQIIPMRGTFFLGNTPTTINSFYTLLGCSNTQDIMFSCKPQQWKKARKGPRVPAPARACYFPSVNKRLYCLAPRCPQPGAMGGEHMVWFPTELWVTELPIREHVMWAVPD